MTVDYEIGKRTAEGMTHMICIEGTHGCENPKPCQTELIVLEYGTYNGNPVTKILLKPLTDCAPYHMILHAYFLHIPMEAEPIEVMAGDPFMTSIDPKWVLELGRLVQEIYQSF
ncbi:RUSD1 protein, partial [Polyodon spathula]|nr:RUSD1 protein [Polyodon spathula]